MLWIKNIETLYGDTILALRGVSLHMPEGKIVALLGPNGAGKSTVLKTLMGLLDDQPDKGTIEFQGQRIDGRSAPRIARLGISLVPEGRDVFPDLTVRENLWMGSYFRSGRQAIADDLEEVYRLFPKLQARSRQLAGTLSGGEQQMLAIGRGLMARPRRLCLDEPSLGLSPLLVKETLQAIKKINERGVTVLLVEQNARGALGIADYGFLLETGRIVLEGTSEELLANEDVQEFYLGVSRETGVRGTKRYKRKKRWR